MVNGSGNEWFMAATMAMVRHTYHHLVHMFAMVYLTIVVFAIATTSNFMMQVQDITNCVCRNNCCCQWHYRYLPIVNIIGIANAFAIVVTMASALAIILAGTFSTQIEGCIAQCV